MSTSLRRFVPALAALLCASAASVPCPTQEPTAAGEEPAAEAPPGPVRRALVVGVGAYPARTSWPALHGPPRDAREVARVLVERAGFAAEDVTLLVDAQATRGAILEGLERLIAASGTDDVLLFFFAGHGSQLADDDGDEVTDGWDETLVPYDAAGGQAGYHDIRDDEIEALIARANEKTDQVVLIFDCCSSATNTKGADDLVPRFLEPRKRGLGAARPTLLADSDTGSGYVPARLRYVALSACRATQSAYEMWIDRGGSREPRGVFTYSLVEALDELGNDLSYAELMTRVADRVARRVENQSPVIEGPLYGYRLFDAVAQAHALRCELEIREDGGMTLDGGKLRGLQAGGVFAVCAPDALRDSRELRLGRVRLTSVAGYASSAEWIDDGSAPPEAGRYPAFQLERGRGTAALPVAIDAPAELASELAERLAATGVLSRADGDAEWTLACSGDAIGAETASRRWTLHARSGLELPLGADASSESELATLVDDLARLGVAHRVAALLADDVPGSLQVRCEFLDPEEKAPLAKGADGALHVDAFEGFLLRATNLGDAPVFVTVLACSPDGEIYAVESPSSEDDAIKPGSSIDSPLRILVPNGLEAFYRAGAVRLCCVATPRFHDLRGLSQGPVTPRVAARGVQRIEPPKLEAAPQLDDESWSTTVLEVRATPIR